MQRVLIVMGVSGSGKTTVGRALAQALGCPFFDADDYHPPANVAKMAAAHPLTDADRAPWLARLQALIAGQLERGQPAVLACSALKRAYRAELSQAGPGLRFIYLRADYALIRQRLLARPDHFMPAGLLASQFADLEEPDPAEALVIEASQNLDPVIAEILAQLNSSAG